MAVLALPRREPVASAIYLDADPNGLAIANGVLYVADGETGTIMRADSTPLAVIDSGGIEIGNRIGGLAAAPDGALYVTRLGYGSAGAIFRINPDGSTIELDLPTEPWRLGIACRGRAVYSTQFYKNDDGPCDGSIIRIADGRISTIARGFGKPVGLAWVGDSLLVTDAKQRGVFSVDGRRYVRALAAPDARPDSICALDRDSALVTTYDAEFKRGAVLRVWLDGRSREIAHGTWEPRGIATDGELAFVSVRRGGRVLVITL
jgi:sugar lactone lactonase YvrE